VSVEALAAQHLATLVERLDAAVRPEFRVDVLVPTVGDPILGTPACMVPGCVHSSRYGGLCLAHLGRWKCARCPDRQAWAASADPEVMGHRRPQPCLVPECGYGQHRYRLCYQHSRAWEKASRPAVDRWKPELRGTPAAVCARLCVVGRTGRGLVPIPPHAVAAAWTPTGRRVHRLLRQRRRGPLRLSAAAAGPAAGDPVRAAMPGGCEPDPHHTDRSNRLFVTQSALTIWWSAPLCRSERQR
jgi:hypothetical protein